MRMYPPHEVSVIHLQNSVRHFTRCFILSIVNLSVFKMAEDYEGRNWRKYQRNRKRDRENKEEIY